MELVALCLMYSRSLLPPKEEECGTWPKLWRQGEVLVPVGLEKVCLPCVFVALPVLLPRQISNSGMTGGGIRVVLLRKHHRSSPTLFLKIFFLPTNLRTATALQSSPRPPEGPAAGVNWDNCTVWGWAAAMPVQLFLSQGNRVAAAFRRDFCTEQSGRNVSRRCGCRPRGTSTLLDTPCCVLSTISLIVQLRAIWCSGSLRIVRWHRSWCSDKLCSSGLCPRWRQKRAFQCPILRALWECWICLFIPDIGKQGPLSTLLPS